MCEYWFIIGNGGCLRLMEVRGWELIVPINDIKIETLLTVIDALI